MLALATLAGCGDGAAPRAPAAASSSTATAATPAGDLTVFAAASLTDAFETIGADFSEANPEVTVAFNFGGSSALAQQVLSGAPADVFAAASPSTMQVVVGAGEAAAEPEVFVTNTLQIAVPRGNPAGVTGLVSFAEEELTIALCAVEVPCGAAASTVFDAAGVVPAPDTLEQDVRAALSKVELGEVDGALVYRTDVIAAGEAVEGIDFAESAEAVNAYPIAVLTGAPNTDAAQAFVAYVTSPQGQQVLAAAGFAGP